MKTAKQTIQLMTENGLTLEEEDAIIKAEKDAMKGKNISKKMGTKEAINHLKKLSCKSVYK